jgi:hypothetical protein
MWQLFKCHCRCNTRNLSFSTYAHVQACRFQVVETKQRRIASLVVCMMTRTDSDYSLPTVAQILRDSRWKVRVWATCQFVRKTLLASLGGERAIFFPTSWKHNFLSYFRVIIWTIMGGKCPVGSWILISNSHRGHQFCCKIKISDVICRGSSQRRGHVTARRRGHEFRHEIWPRWRQFIVHQAEQ